MNHPRLIEIFIQLAKINALSTEEAPVADYITSFLINLGLTPEKDNSSNQTGSNTGNIVCKIGNGGNFLMLSHMDTARPTSELLPIVLEDRIVSNGKTVLGVDNRAGIAILLYTIENAFKQKKEIKDFTLSFTTCEETTLGGSSNLRIDENIEYAFIFDSSHRPGTFIHAACGAKSFNIAITGKPSHSGIAPEKGINAITIAANAISKLEWGRLDNDTTANIGILQGGSAVNVIPEKVVIDGEVRSFDMTKVESVTRKINIVFEDEATKLGGSIVFTDLWDFKPFTVSKEEEVFKNIEKTLIHLGLEPKPVISLGGSDANSLNGRGIPSINLGIGAQNPHANDEFIFIEDLIKSAEIAFELIRKN
jgi:tripeptide aminopeptidase